MSQTRIEAAESGTRRYALIADLNAEWTRLCEQGNPPVRTWADRHVATHSCRTLPDVLGAIRASPDPVLTALLIEAADGDPLAGRVVLQAMLGKVVRLVQTHPGLGAEDFVAAMWCRIRTYPLQRRPNKIAANLAWDTRKDALAAARTSRRESAAGSLSEPSWEPLLAHRADRGRRDAEDDARREARRVLGAAEAAGLIDKITCSVLETVYLDGASSRSAAVHHDTTPELVRYRCSSAVRRMSRHAALLAAS